MLFSGTLCKINQTTSFQNDLSYKKTIKRRSSCICPMLDSTWQIKAVAVLKAVQENIRWCGRQERTYFTLTQGRMWVMMICSRLSSGRFSQNSDQSGKSTQSKIAAQLASSFAQFEIMRLKCCFVSPLMAVCHCADLWLCWQQQRGPRLHSPSGGSGTPGPGRFWWFQVQLPSGAEVKVREDI